MIMLTLKPRAPRSLARSRFHISAVSPRPTRSSTSQSPISAPAPAADPTYLRRWVAHQATTYNDLLKTIAAAPPRHGK